MWREMQLRREKVQVSAGHEEAVLDSILSAVEVFYRVLNRRGNRK